MDYECKEKAAQVSSKASKYLCSCNLMVNKAVR